MPYQYHQRGGTATPRQWLVIALLVAGLASGAMNVYQMRHRCIEVTMPVTMLPTTVITPEPVEEFGAVHAFPPGREVCDSFDTICWTKI